MQMLEAVIFTLPHVNGLDLIDLIVAIPQAVDNHMHCFAIYYKFLWLLGALSQTPL